MRTPAHGIVQPYAYFAASGCTALVALWVLTFTGQTNALGLAPYTVGYLAIGGAAAELCYRFERQAAQRLATEIGAAVTELREMAYDKCSGDEEACPAGDLH